LLLSPVERRQAISNAYILPDQGQCGGTQTSLLVAESLFVHHFDKDPGIAGKVTSIQEHFVAVLAGI
jgi:hypothetical protein